jgi:hypothetical protein
MRAVILALAAATVTACGSYSTFKTTRIARPGHNEWLFGAQIAGIRAIDPPGDARGAIAPMPEVALGWRRGVRERYEVQVNGTIFALKQGQTASLEVAGKARILQRGRWSLATGAGIGYRLAGSSGAVVEGVFGSLPLIGGVELGRHQLVLSVVGGYQRWYSSGATPVGVPFIGQSLGFVWQVGKNWALLPEVGAAWTPKQNFMSETSQLFHLGLAAMWTH